MDKAMLKKAVMSKRVAEKMEKKSPVAKAPFINRFKKNKSDYPEELTDD